VYRKEKERLILLIDQLDLNEERTPLDVAESAETGRTETRRNLRVMRNLSGLNAQKLGISKSVGIIRRMASIERRRSFNMNMKRGQSWV
jgi:hypothetical protein